MSEQPLSPLNRPPSIDQIARAISDLDLPHPLLVDAAREAVNKACLLYTSPSPRDA